MKRRKRRKARRSALPALAGLLALAVVAGAVVLILRGDTTPRPHRTLAHRRQPALAASSPAVVTPAPVAETPAARPSAANAAVAPTAPPTLPAVTASAGPTAAASAAPTAAGSAAPAAAPRLALIIDDCGQWPTTERGFIALPVALTLSVLPHVRYGDAIARDALAAGKGVMLHLPMEPRSGAYPGPGEVTVAMDDAAITAQVQADIAAVPLAAGVNNHEGSRASADDRVMRAVGAVIAAHHLFFVDSRTSPATVAARDAAALGIPTASRDVFLDDVADVAATQAALRRAVALAKQRGSAIAIGHPRPTTLAAVRALLPELQREGIDFVLARDLVR